MNTRLLRVVGFLKTLIEYFTDFVQYNVLHVTIASSRGICHLIHRHKQISFQKLRNFWVTKALMSLNILYRILNFFNLRRAKSTLYNGLKFDGTLISSSYDLSMISEHHQKLNRSCS